MIKESELDEDQIKVLMATLDKSYALLQDAPVVENLF